MGRKSEVKLGAVVWQAMGIAVPELEYRFCPGRKWRSDYAWPAHKLVLEVEGGIWTGGRHVSGVGFSRDMEKYNWLAEHGWRILRYPPPHRRSFGIDFDQVRRALG